MPTPIPDPRAADPIFRPEGAHKKRSIKYSKRDGNHRLEYWVVDESRRIRTCAPRTWHAVDLPDMTHPAIYFRAAEMRLASVRGQFKHRVEDSATLRTLPDDGRPGAVRLCEHHDILF